VNYDVNIILGPVGFCFGVSKAIDQIKKGLLAGEYLFTDGEVIHNKNVVQELEKLGLVVEKIKIEVAEGADKSEPNNESKKTFVVRAHGLPPKRIEKLSSKYKILDLTCPIVKNVFRLVEKLSDKGWQIVAFGKNDHAEMLALSGHVPNAIITTIPVRVESEKIAIVSQTTSFTEDFENFVKQMRYLNRESEIQVYNTICSITVDREKATRYMAENCDVLLIVGGKNSSNTRKLFEIGNQLRHAIFVEDINEFKEIEKNKFTVLLKKHEEKLINIGIVSGTSTPVEDARNIVSYISEKYGGRELSMEEFKNINDVNGTTNETDNSSFEELLNEFSNMDEIGRGRIVDGVITEITPTGLNVDLGWKGMGIVPLEELFKDISEYSLGEKIKVRIEKLNEDEGTVLLSEKKPMERIVKEEIKKAYEEGRTVWGKIVERKKGGYRVVISNLVEAFLPGSESNLKENEEIPDEKLDFAIISFEQRGRNTNVVVSRKRVFQKMLNEFFENRKVGDVVEGIVESIDDKGAFVKISGFITGYVPNSEVSYNSSATARNMLSIGKTMKFVIRDIDSTKRRVLLSVKALLPDPWESATQKFNAGQNVTGIVTSIKPFGFFAKIDDGIEGLVPISEIFWGKPGKIEEVVSIGDPVRLEIVEIVPEKKRMVLSYKNVIGDPWEKIDEKFPEGSIVEGKIIKALPNGVILELEPNVTAFCNISEISWNFVDSTDSVVKEGDKVKVKILDVDKDNKKIRVSIRKALPNPWETFAKNHKEGDNVTAKIIKIVNKGYIGLCEHVEVYIPKTQVYDNLSIGSEISGKIMKIEQQKEIYKIIVSPKIYGNEKAVIEAEKEGIPSQISLEEKLEDGRDSNEE